MILGSGSGARSNGGRLSRAPRPWAAILNNMLYYLHFVPFYEPRDSISAAKFDAVLPYGGG
jgi:hypothetical protein